MNRYSNMWTDGITSIKSDIRPGADFSPMYAKSRIVRARSGYKGYMPYEPKDGSPEWVSAANRLMANACRD